VKETIENLKKLFCKEHEIYVAYYVMRTDGDADLYAVAENGENTDEILASKLVEAIEHTLANSSDEWFKVDHIECDFPDVWDSS
jgi:hypothetical protein